MKLKFKHQKFQTDAAKAIVDVFKGQAYHKMTPTFTLDVPITTLEVIGNIYEDEDLLEDI